MLTIISTVRKIVQNYTVKEMTKGIKLSNMTKDSGEIKEKKT